LRGEQKRRPGEEDMRWLITRVESLTVASNEGVDVPQGLGE